MNRNFISRTKFPSSAIYLISTGFFSILGQIIILRELNVAFYGIELIYILSFGIWMIGTALGISAGRTFTVPKEKNILILFILFSCLLLTDILFIRGIRNIFGGVEGGYLPFTTQITGLIIALVPLSISAGLLFQWSAKNFINEKQTLAKAYSIESAGGIAGALTSTLFLSLNISNFTAALICGGGSFFTANCFLWKRLNRFQKYFSLTLLIFIFFILGISHKIDLLTTSWNHPFVVESLDTPYSRVTITSPEKQVCVFEDDALSYETESVAAEEFVHLSALQCSRLNNVLVLGGGFQGIIAELFKLHPGKINYVELNKSIIEALQKYLPERLTKCLLDERVNLIYKDPRRFLPSSGLYDLILVGMPEPMSAQSNRFYTKEFFAQCAEALNKNGVIAFKISSSENIWTRELAERNNSIYTALKSSFKNAVVLPGSVNIFIGSKTKLNTDPKSLSDLFLGRKLETRLVSPQYINYIFTNNRFKEIQRLLSNGTKKINSDLQPVCYLYTISIWLSKFFPGLANSGNLFDKPDAKLLITASILILGLITAGRKYFKLGRFILVFGAGFIGMTAETLLLILYQTKNGVLYRDIGILLMMFMAGLAAGAAVIHRASASTNIKRFNRSGISLIFFLILMNSAIYLLMKWDMLQDFLTISIFLFLDGMIVSGIFAYASLNKVSNQLEIVKPLYSADLIGGSLGSIIASLMLIPVAGFLSTSLLLAAAAFLLFFLI